MIEPAQKGEPKLLPFHESIIEIIKGMTLSDTVSLRQLILCTEIPANHEAIADAWDSRRSVPDYGLRDVLMERKREIEKKRESDRHQDWLEANQA